MYYSHLGEKIYSVLINQFFLFKDFPGNNRVSVEVAQNLLKNENLAYTELSQAIHPILGTPFLYLHPCMSSNLLEYTSKR